MDIKQYLPSDLFKKRLIFLALLVVLILTIPKLFKYIVNLAGKTHPVTAEQADIIASIDTDNDGVYDWQEKLWGTDPTKKATFNGIPDSEYIAQKQEVLNTEDAQNDNKTDILSKQLFATINAITSKGDPSTMESNYAEIANNVAQYVTEDTTKSESISVNDLVLVPNTKANKTAYFKNIASMAPSFFNKKTAVGIGDELPIIYYALEHEDPSHLPDLNPIIVSYNDLAKKLTNIKVPVEISNDHVNLINNLYSIASELTQTQSLFSDSVVGIRGVVGYNKTITDLDVVIDKIQTYASQ